MKTNAQLDAEVVELDSRRKGRIRLVPFNSIKLSTDRRYLVKGLIPHPGLTLIGDPRNQEKASGPLTSCCVWLLARSIAEDESTKAQ